MGPSLLKNFANQSRWAIPVLLCSGGSLFYFAHRVPRPLHPLKQSAVLPTILEAANTSFGLAAKRQGHDLVLSWNTESPAIVSAVTGILVIQTREDLQDFTLGPRELRSGRFVYKSTAEQIDIRLHVFDRNDKQTNDTAVLSFARDSNRRPTSQLLPEPNSAAAPGSPAAPRQKNPEVTIHNNRVWNRPHKESEPLVSGASDVLLETPPLVKPQSFPSATVTHDWFAQPVVVKPPSNEASALAQAVTISPLRPKMNAIPLLRRLRPDSDFVPPTPIRRPSPELPANLSQGLKHVVSVDVKVFIAATGAVQYAELLSDGTGPDRNIASFAVFQARDWKFDPARLKGQPVAGEVVLHYRFGPSTGPEPPRVSERFP